MQLYIRSIPKFAGRSFAVFVATALLVTIGQASSLKAQFQKDTTHWNDEDLYTGEPVPQSYFAVGGGIIGGAFFANLTDFNSQIAQPFVHENAPSTIFMLGGQGFITVPWVKGLRVGGMGASGSSACNCVDTTINGSQKSRMLTYSVGYGALTLDYVLPLHVPHFSIVPGIALGFGSVQIYAQQDANTITPFDINTSFTAGTDDLAHTYHASFFFYMPQLQFEYSIKGFSMIRLSVGYQGTSMGTWMEDQGVSLGGPGPLANINGAGLVANLGIFFGLFPN